MRLLLYFFIFSSLVALSVVIYLSFFSGPGTKAGLMMVKNLPGATMQGVRYSGSRGGSKGWELEAERARHFKDTGLIKLSVVKLLYYNADQEASTVTGNEATYDDSSGELEIEGNVKVFSADGYELRTEALTYSTATSEVSTDETVEFKADGMHVTGEGLKMNIYEGDVSIYGGVTTILDDLSI